MLKIEKVIRISPENNIKMISYDAQNQNRHGYQDRGYDSALWKLMA